MIDILKLWIKRNKSGNSTAPDPIEEILSGRGMDSEESILEFLQGEFDPLKDIGALKDADRFLETVLDAMDKKKRIVIYGDYDVDGITSISILMKTFSAIGYPASYYIPDRIDEGYGLNDEALRLLRDQGFDLVITVDCGVTSVSESKTAEEIGLDLIITDHHQCGPVLPRVKALVNTKREDCVYPYDMLAGAGIAFKLAHMILKEKSVNPDHDVFGEILILSSIGTIADVAPLSGENRIIVREGLKLINEMDIPFISALAQDNARGEKHYDAIDMAFKIAPKINASGRIGNPRMGVELLLEKDVKIINELAGVLIELNDQRKELEIMVTSQCIELIDKGKLHKNKVIVVHGESFHSGVIGIAASRIAEKYNRPAVILSFDSEEGLYKASARSVNKISIYRLLDTVKHHFVKFGGHDAAAGFSMKEENYIDFQRELLESSESMIPDCDLISTHYYDALISSGHMTFDFIDRLSGLEPFGHGNPKPVFKIDNVTLERKSIIGKNKNVLKLAVSKDNRVFDAICFSNIDKLKDLKIHDNIDILFNIEKNTFNGITNIQLVIKDVRQYSPSEQDMILYEMAKAKSFYFNAQTSPEGYVQNQNVLEIGIRELEGVLDDKKGSRLVIFTSSVKDAIEIQNKHMESMFPDFTFEILGSDNRFKATHEKSRFILFPVYSRVDFDSFDSIIRISDIGSCRYLEVPDRDQLARIYKHLRSNSTEGAWNESSVLALARVTGLDYFNIIMCLEFFKDENMIDYFDDELEIKYIMKKVEKKIDILASEFYMNLIRYKKDNVHN